MKNVKKILGVILCVLSLTMASSALATTEVQATSTPVAVQTVPSPSTSLFNASEFGLALSSGYVLDTSAPFKQAYSFNTSVGAFWFPFRNFGVEANLPFYSTAGVSVQEVQFGTILRLPLSSEKAILKNIAPYIGIGGVYNWQTDSQWAYTGKVGVDVRLNKKWGLFVENQYRNDSFSEWTRGQNTLQGGLKLVF